MSMENILSSNVPTHLLGQLQQWFESEWEKVDPLQVGGAPEPLVVTDDQGSLLGGLAFTVSPKPGNTEPGVWINALMISPDSRRRGIASRLIHAAELSAWRKGVQDLYVYTDVPDLYSQNGWTEVAREHGHSTLTKSCTKTE